MDVRNIAKLIPDSARELTSMELNNIRISTKRTVISPERLREN